MPKRALIASEKKILSVHLAAKLQLSQEDKMKSWIGSLSESGIVITHGIKKGTEYLLNPDLFAQAKLNIKPSLKTVEPYKIEALIFEYIRYNGARKLSKIQSQLNEIPESSIQKAVYKMVAQGDLITEGAKRNRTYRLSKKK